MVSLVIAEHDNTTLSATTQNVISAALALQSEIDIAVIGFRCDSVVEQCQKLEHIRKVIALDHEVYQYQLAENLAPVIAELSQPYSHVLIAASSFGKDVMPRVAAHLDLMQISDVVKIIDADTFVRPIYAGNAFLTVTTKDKIKLLTVRTTSFPPVDISEKRSEVEKKDIVVAAQHTRFKESSKPESKRPELTSAKIVVAGGRGLQKRENFQLIERLADQLGAAIGATRAAVDAGYVPNDCQVGQTGKVVAPDLYIAIGISGAIQHLAGMKDSKLVVAINKDPDAPIFQMADYGLVGDLFTVLPELQKELTKLGYQ